MVLYNHSEESSAAEEARGKILADSSIIHLVAWGACMLLQDPGHHARDSPAARPPGGQIPDLSTPLGPHEHRAACVCGVSLALAYLFLAELNFQGLLAQG